MNPLLSERASVWGNLRQPGSSLAVAIMIGVLLCTSRMVPAAESNEPLEVGVAQVDVTPDYAIRLNGFGGRRAESEGVTQKIWAKALAFGDARLGPAVIITTDNLGIPAEMTQEIAKRLAKTGLKPDRLSITASHSHTAPMLKDVAPTIFGVPIPPEHQAHIDQYTREFTDKLEQVALAAIRDIRPSRVSWGVGSATFATNRRTPGGPVDHDLPVLVVRDLEGKPRAIYFSYACHCVTLSHNKISGDWLGYAMEEVQQKFPGAIALASVGCGADSNPSSGVTGGKFEIASKQGGEIAREVGRLLGTPLTAITNRPVTRLTQIELPFAKARTRAEWEQRAKANDAAGHQARVSLARLDRGETLPTKIYYPVQSWMFGDQLAMVFLAGEVVVDYSLRLKREFDRGRIWVNAYANDAPCYIPSERVLKEGGYEGGDAMIYYDRPQKLATGLEQKIVNAVRAEIPKPYLAPEGTEGTAPTPPSQALNTLRTKSGLIVELAAAEPLVNSPVAIDWDASGRLWVCEMVDYPTGLDENWQPGGRIKRLRDTNGDGIYDEATVFLDGLPFPTGIMAWGRGVLICAAPDIIYAEDTNGDGKADRVEKMFSGFAAENYQARVNSLSLGLDNWIYGANGLLGGVIRGRNSTLDIRGSDFRFRFSGGPMETVNGLTQQGRVRDDWGRWFGCNNGNALIYYPHEGRYLRRNPNVPAPASSLSLPGNFDVGRVYPSSRLLERFNDPGSANHITSGCGLGLYRDTLLGSEYYNNAFTCEPVHNLVHRLIIKEDGLELSRRRADDEKQSEFLSSTDNWFRPVQVRTGPDGALYVVDMYRFLIEHPRWIPAARLAKINVRAGAAMGRIYRVRAGNETLRPIRDLSRLDAPALAAALNSPNGTERDRAQVELLARPAKGTQEAVEKVARTAALPQARLQAMSALDGLGVLEPKALVLGLGDADEQVRSESVRMCESFFGNANRNYTRELFSKLLSLTNETSLLVVRQLAFTLGEWREPAAGIALAHVARNWLQEPEVRIAVLSSAGRHGAEVLSMILNLDPKTPGAEAWLEPLVATAAASKDESLFNQALLALLSTKSSAAAPNRFAALAHLLNALDRRNTTPHAYFESHSELRGSESRLTEMLSSAARIAGDAAAPPNAREAAIQLLGRAGASDAEIELLCQVLVSQASEKLRAAASAGLRHQRSSRVPDRLLTDWNQRSPVVRQEIINLLLGRDSWTLRLLESIKDNVVQSTEISLADRQRLAKSADAGVRRLTAEVLPPQLTSARAEVLEKFKPALALAGHEENGREVFTKNCSSCHALREIGHAVGPDLSALRGKEPDYWLKNILDPNAVIEPRFVAYSIETRDDRSLSGVIKSETANSLTLVSGNGLTETIPRSEIKSIRASNLSLMPEGLDQAMNLQEMADLLAFVMPRTPAKRFSGNVPSVITPSTGGTLFLPAARAEIFGGNIAFETPFQNIGMWQSSEDHAAWQLEVNKAGAYDVHLDYACAANSAGNSFVMNIGSLSVTGKVASTGPDWSRYAQSKVGTVQLEAGRYRLSVRPNGILRGALMDLRTVALCPTGQSPAWPTATAITASSRSATPAHDGLLRDPVSIARYLMDAGEPASAREAAIRANPQFAADFISEMTRDLKAGPAEYERIPWIWRVAISCGKRNEPLQIKRVLETSLPLESAPLRDWQAVVLGGGIINGLSQRGLWPDQVLGTIVAEDAALLKRLNRATELAAEMSDDPKVPTGTRYDALRMLGIEPWKKRGKQLTRYLGKGGNGELQMGAVSAMVDISAPEATSALISALDHLKGHNRELALEGLLRDESRAKALIESAKARKWNADLLGTNLVAKLQDYPNPTLRAQARELFPR
ncbi:MAG TPA: PVC-type heme-binding CxxCH protein [Candidatus Saccharimonadales bacterium]|nr:PVC-type heme-binding CxxCH protein [Candidatus Saccharimonadales bacterium]